MKKQALLSLLKSYAERFVGDEHVTKTIDFIKKQDDFWQSSTQEGHITASAWILNADSTMALLTHHAKLDQWFQLGGHVEACDGDIAAACMREAYEESGSRYLKLVHHQIFDIDVHQIPASKSGFPAHWHFDIRMLFVAENETFAISTESKELRWVELDKIKELTQSDSVLRMVVKTRALH